MKIEYENHYLTDQDIANFARQSFAKLAKNYTKSQNTSLIQFLARGMSTPDWNKLINQMEQDLVGMENHNLAVNIRNIPEHWVPFGHPQISLRCSAPIPIKVQCFKHKIGFVESEESRRYISSEPVVYVPKTFRMAAKNVKQGSGDTHEDSASWRRIYERNTKGAVNTYLAMINAGICPEQARFVLPQGVEANWVWTGSLYAFANMYNQRSDSHAQKEIQDIAKQVDAIISKLYPIAWPALTKGQY